jgi:OAH/OAS sulfhydrylase
MSRHSYGFDTLQLHAGQNPDKQTGARAVPIYQSTSFCYGSAEEAAAVFSGEQSGYTYSRIVNPTVAVLEERVTALEQGAATVCFASGMGAISAAILALCETGDEIVAMSTLYGGTYTLFAGRLKDICGITVRFVDIDDFKAVEAAINAKTKCVYIETIGNPAANIPEIETIADIAHGHGLPLVADNTFGTPYLITARNHGIDISVHSLTKYMGGHGTSLAGSVTDLGTFDFHNPRFKAFTTPDTANHGIIYADEPAPVAARLRTQLIRDFGACLSPFNAFLILLGIETLSLRVDRHVKNALAAAEFLKSHAAVSYVNYPSLKDDKYFERAQKYFPKGAGAIMSFGVKGGLSAGRKLMNHVKLFSILANVADAKSLIIHPASTTHGQLTEAELKLSGVAPELVRLSIGLEDINDIIFDLKTALEGGF